MASNDAAVSEEAIAHALRNQGQLPIASMSPADASTRLAEMKTAYDAQNTPAPSSPAATRLNQMMSDRATRDAYLLGTPAVVREVNSLHEQIADVPEGVRVETVDSVSDTYALPRDGYAALFDGLREQGLPDRAEQYIRALDAGQELERATAGDKVAAQRALNRLTNDREFGRRVLAGDVAASNVMNSLSRVIALALDDGKPVSPVVAEFIARL